MPREAERHCGSEACYGSNDSGRQNPMQDYLKKELVRERELGERGALFLFLLSECKVDDIIKVGCFALAVRKRLMKGNKLYAEKDTGL